MSRIFNRPMFKRGGSAGQGITTGLDRPGYANGLDVQKVKELKEQTLGMYGQPPRGYGVYDFLTDWGLRMASATPKGNVLQTAASEAIEPHEKLMAGKSEAEMAEYLAGIKATDLSISSLTDIAAAKAKNQNLLDENEARAIGTIHAQVLKENPNTGTFGNANAETIAWSRYKIRILGQNTDEPVTARVIEGDVDDGGAWALDDNGRWDYDVQKLAANLVWLDPLGKKYIVVQDTDKDGYGDGDPKEFSSYAEAKSYLDNARTVENITEESTGTGEKKVVDWDIEVEQEKFKDVTKYTEEYLREKFKTYIQGLRNKQSIASQAGTGVQIMPDLSTEDTVFWRNYQKDPERAYQRWKNKITSFGKKQKKQIDLSEKIGVDIDYGIKKADGGLMRNIRNIDEDSANELQAWWDSQRFTN
jgi:hypothetical protein